MKIVVLISALYYCSLQAQEDQTIGFSADFLAAVAQQPDLGASNRIKTFFEQEKQPASQWITLDTVESSITPAATIYTLIKLVALYRMVYSQMPVEHVVDNSWLMAAQQHIVSLVYPSSVHNNARFVIGSCRIIIEVLLYKTLAQMLVLCLKGNIFDAIEQIMARMALLAKRIIGL